MSDLISPAQLQTLTFILTLYWRCSICGHVNHPLWTVCDRCGEPKMDFSEVSTPKAK